MAATRYPALLKHFPGLQIFATTHSPFVVAGLKAGQAHLLKRDDEGKVTATTNPEDIVGWTADEILRNMMGVEDPTDDATAQQRRSCASCAMTGPSTTRRQKRSVSNGYRSFVRRWTATFWPGGRWQRGVSASKSSSPRL